jgi:hypothetical protein
MGRVEMTLLPAEFRNRLQSRARKATALKLENYIELRDFIAENKDKISAVGWMEFYKEAGDSMDLSAETVRKNLTIIRNYPDEKLREWVKFGLSFDHIENANWLQNVKECQYTAEALLDAAAYMGNGEGRRMTVEEMTTFALGEKVKPSVKGMVSSLFDRLVNFPNRLNWDTEKSTRFSNWLLEGKEFFDA